MRPECVIAVKAAAAKSGKDLSQARIDEIERRIRETMQSEWSNNREDMGKLSPGERNKRVADIVAKDLIAQKQKDLRQAAENVVKEATARRFTDVNGPRMGVGGHMEALSRLFVNYLDDKVGAKSVEQIRTEFASFYGRQMEGIGKATMKYAGFWEDAGMVHDMYMEAHEEGSSGNAKARHIVKEWGDVAEAMRMHLNENGANIRKLPGWLIPQNHSWYKVAVGKFDKWHDFVLPRLNKDAYLNERGERMTDEEIRKQVLDPSYRSIATDGADDGVLQKKGAGDLSKRGLQARVLHFKDGQSALEYHREFGQGNVLENMLHHISKSAQTYSGLKQFGSHDYATARRLIDYAHQKDRDANPEKGGALQSRAHRLEAEYRVATGRVGMTGNPHIASFFQGLRSILAAAHLGTAPISALTDSSNGMMVANAWNMGVQNWMRNEAKGLTSAEFRRSMRAQGFGIEQIGHMMSRWSEDMTGHGIPSYLANTVFRITGLNALDGARRSSLGNMLMERIGSLTDKYSTLGEANAQDVAKLKEAGTDEQTWKVWQQVDKDAHGVLSPDAIMSIPDEKLAHLGTARAAQPYIKGQKALPERLILKKDGTPKLDKNGNPKTRPAQAEIIGQEERPAEPFKPYDPDQLRRDAAMHLIGTISRDVATVVPMMTDRQRARFEHSAGAKGTIAGELTRSIIQFKSFPLAMIGNHYQRMMSKPTPQGKALYALELAVTSTLLGAASTQAYSLVTGSNPQDIRTKNFWLKAFLKGGSGGLYADVALAPYASSYKQDLLASAGPIPSLVNQALFTLPAKAKESLVDHKPGFGGEAIRTLKGLTPGANMWWSRAATDHLFWQLLQDHASPGYSERLLERTQQEGNTTMWWKPSSKAGVSTPQVPNLNAAVGKR